MKIGTSAVKQEETWVGVAGRMRRYHSARVALLSTFWALIMSSPSFLGEIALCSCIILPAKGTHWVVLYLAPVHCKLFPLLK